MNIKEITSIEIRNKSSGPICGDDVVTQKLIIYRNGKVEHYLYNGISLDPIKEYVYRVANNEIEQFFTFLTDEIKIGRWKDYYSVPVCDGWSWVLDIRYSDHTIRKISGTVEAPPRGKRLEEYIKKMISFKDRPWIF